MLEVDQALITMTGFDGLSFTSLLHKFTPLFDDYPLQNKHKSHPVEARSFKRRLSKEGSPGGLSWRGSLVALQLIFGMTCSNLCMYLQLDCHTIVEALKSDSLAIPSNKDIESYKETIDAMPVHYLQQSGKTKIQDLGLFLQQVDA